MSGPVAAYTANKKRWHCYEGLMYLTHFKWRNPGSEIWGKAHKIWNKQIGWLKLLGSRRKKQLTGESCIPGGKRRKQSLSGAAVFEVLINQCQSELIAHHQDLAAATREAECLNVQRCQVVKAKRAECFAELPCGQSWRRVPAAPRERYLSQPLWSGAEREGPSLTRPSHGPHSRCRWWGQRRPGDSGSQGPWTLEAPAASQSLSPLRENDWNYH